MKRNEYVKRGRSAAATLLALLLSLWTLADAIPPARAIETDPETGELLIATVEDFAQFSRACTVNTWSQGKSFRLTANIDLTGRAFRPIPIFSGEFSGDGFTISGLRITANGSNMGLFRYVQEGAVIRSLNVSGTVEPVGDAEQVGGLAGVNAGSLLDCTFDGTVSGKRIVGGIAGENLETGEISGCTARGTVQGRTRAGGIVGRNSGLLLKCWNECAVNPAAAEESVPVTATIFDTGGVAGVSFGVLQNCTNIGTIGAAHVGYNVGGIVGRQAGYLSGCENRGSVRGRKDVGGIVGQAEPDITLLANPDTLSELRSQLNTMTELINSALESNETNRSGLATQLQQLNRHTDTARDLSRRLVEQSSQATETEVTNIRSMASSVSGALDRTRLALTSFTGAIALAQSAENQLDASIGSLEDTRILEDETIDALKACTQQLRSATEELSGVIEALNGSIEDLENAALVQDDAAQKEALWKLADAVGAVAEVETERRNALESMGSALNRGFPLNTNDVQAALGRVSASLRDQVSALRSLGDAVGRIAQKSSLDWDSLAQGLRTLKDPANSILTAVRKIPGASSDLSAALRNLEDPSGLLIEPMSRMAGAADTLAAAGAELESGYTALYRAASDLQETRPVSVTVTRDTEALRSTGNSLYGALATLANSADALYVAVTRMEDRVSANLQGISQQLDVVAQAMTRTLENIQNGSVGADDVVEDASDVNIDATRLGKITESVNMGPLEADRNAGGIAGIVGIEYDLDPEDDITGAFTFGSSLQTKAVIQKCRNEGSVTTRKDCAGGVAGRMNLGTLLGCENYGSVKSTAGAYVGGLAGRSGGVVRESWSRCTLSGERYVGGIAGQAEILRNCRAVASFASTADGTEYLGSIAGDANPSGGNIMGNLFLDSGGVGGIDGVSYIGIAEPASWETLQIEGGPPEAFIACAVTFVIDGVEVDRVPFNYGDDLSGLVLPEIPAKENLHGYWPAFDTAGLHPDVTLEPVYEPWITVLDSTMKSNGRPLALAEGRFTRDAALRVTESDVGAPAGSDSLVMDIRLEGTGLTDEDLTPMRLLNQTGGQATVWRFHEDRWRTVNARANGRYLLLDLEGLSGTYCVIPGGQGQATMIRHLIPVGLFVLLALVIARVIGVRAEKKEKTGNGGTA